MWQFDKGLIQVEIGPGILQASTPPDKRSLLEKLQGTSAPEEGQLLLEYSQTLREHLWQNEGLILPRINWTDNYGVDHDELIVYIGLNCQRFKIRNLEDIFNYLAYKVREYNQISSDKASLREVFESCLQDINNNKYQYAFEKHQKIYYHSFLQGFNYEIMRCLSESGAILLKNGDLVRAQAAFKAALPFINDPNIVEAHLKSQVAYNAGEAFKITQHFQDAYNCYLQAGLIAQDVEDTSLMFLSFVGLAETTYNMRMWDLTLHALEEAKKLIRTQPNPHRDTIASNLSDSMIEIYKQLRQQENNRQAASAPTLFNDFKREILKSLINSIVGAFTYKLFGVSGGTMLAIFGDSTEYTFNKETLFFKDVSGSVEIKDFQNRR
ncbi:MAG: hypothetical protein WED00_12295 [Aquisalimonadaceae bacterium]